MDWIWCRSLVFEGMPALSGLTGTAAGQRATTEQLHRDSAKCDTITSRARRCVCPGDSSIHPQWGRRYADVRKGVYARKPRYVYMLIVSYGLQGSHKCLRPALPALPRPTDACQGGEVVCHKWITSYIRSWRTAPSGRCRGIVECNDDGDDGEGPGFYGFVYMRQIIFDIGTWSSISAGCSAYGIRD
jgi:hypothetical protein